MQLEFYWDAAGDARARCKGRGRVVAGFLESDLQESVAAAHEVLRALDDVDAGRTESWERIGNAHSLVLDSEGASILNEMKAGAKPYHLSLPEIREIVADWISFLENGRRS